MKPELKQCPFCGGRAYLARTGTHKQSCIVECESCGGCLETGEEGDQCGTAWNRRAQPDEPVKVTINTTLPSEIGHIMGKHGLPPENIHDAMNEVRKAINEYGTKP